MDFEPPIDNMQRRASTRIQRFNTKIDTEYDVIRRNSIGHLKDSMVEFLTTQMSASHKNKLNRRNSLGIPFNSHRPSTIRKIVQLDLKNKEVPEEVKDDLQKDSIPVWIDDSWILNPEHPRRKSWDLFFLLPSVLYTAVRVPFAIGFNIDETDQDQLGWFVLNRLVDLFFVIDMVMVFHTSIRDGKKWIVERKDIARHYFKTWFLLDFMATIPFDVILFLVSNEEGNSGTSTATRSTKLLRVAKIFRTLRILRLLRIQRIAQNLQMALGVSFSLFSILKFGIVFLMLAHIVACGLLAIANEHDVQGTDNWFKATVNTSTRGDQYTAALHWAFQTMTTIGYGDIKIGTDSERIFACFGMIIGGAMFTYLITRVVHIVSMMDKSDNNLINELTVISEWSQYYSFPNELVDEIKTYYRYKNTTQYFDEDNMLNNLSESLKRDIYHFMYDSFFKHVEVFEGCCDAFLLELMMKIRTEVAPPFTLVLTEGTQTASMYLVRRGHLGAYNRDKDGAVAKALILGPGHAIAEFALLKPNRDYIAQTSVVTLEWSDLAIIHKRDFADLIKYYPSEAVGFSMKAHRREKQLKRLKKRLSQSEIAVCSPDELRASNDLLTQIGLELGGTAFDKLHSKHPAANKDGKIAKKLILESSSKTSEQCRYYMARHIERMSSNLDKMQEKLGMAFLLGRTEQQSSHHASTDPIELSLGREPTRGT